MSKGGQGKITGWGLNVKRRQWIWGKDVTTKDLIWRWLYKKDWKGDEILKRKNQRAGGCVHATRRYRYCRLLDVNGRWLRRRGWAAEEKWEGWVMWSKKELRVSHELLLFGPQDVNLIQFSETHNPTLTVFCRRRQTQERESEGLSQLSYPRLYV